MLFNIYINDLIVKLNQRQETLGFADDIVVIAKGIDQMNNAIDILENWSI